MKKLIIVLLCFSMLISISACNSNTPENTVKRLCDAIRSDDYVKLKDCLAFELGYFDDSSIEMSELLKKWHSEIRYEIRGKVEHDDNVTVGVDFTYTDASQVISVAAANYFSKAFALAFTGASQETLASVFLSCLDDAAKSTETKQAEKTIIFTLTQDGSEWLVQELPEDFLDVFTSNTYTTLYNIFNQQSTDTISSNESQPSSSYSFSNSYETLSDFNSNDYYDVIQQDVYSSSYYTYLTFAVKAKKDGKVSATVIFYDDEGNIVEKQDDSIVLCEGYINYFSFYFDNDVQATTYNATVKAKEVSFSESERKAVVMDGYNISNNYLFITFVQTGDKIDFSDKYKILYLKDNRIIASDSGRILFVAENLGEKNSTDVAKISVYGKDFDDLIFIYEPYIY